MGNLTANYCQPDYLESLLILLEEKGPFDEICNSCQSNLCMLPVTVISYFCLRGCCVLCEFLLPPL